MRLDSKFRNSCLLILTALQLSIIIVNYNVRLFLEQCLCSVGRAMDGLAVEVIVIDNNSTDDSIGYLQPKFPFVTFISNRDNCGFGKANNQGLAIANGEFILFLNPDTLLPEDCLALCIEHITSRPEVGALGIKMMDGTGAFLPESKRAFPSPLTSFFKLTGLSSVFKQSRLFSRYHLGHLDPEQNHEVDVLAGAFMLVRRLALDSTGGFDEMFFMYGEDVDLSFRIQEAGWKNIYFSGSSIIHFKGESTKKGSLNYVRMFYQAMSLFVKKHYGGSKAAIFNLFIQFAIWLRAGLSAVASVIRSIGLPLIDAAIVMSCLLLVKNAWSVYIKPGVEVPREVWLVSLPCFTLLFILTGSISGLYDKWYRPRRAALAMFLAIVFNLAVYSLLSEGYRFSRGVILLGGCLAAISIILFRLILVKSKVIATDNELHEYRQTIIVASLEAFGQTEKMMQAAGRTERILGRVSPNANLVNAIGQLKDLDRLLENIPARELIFCLDETLSMKKTIELLGSKRSIRFKFHYHNTESLVGSDSKESSGEALIPLMSFNIGKPEFRRFKRVSDILWCLGLLITLPFHLLLVKRPARFFGNVLRVLFGKSTWVGYNCREPGLPQIKPGVITANAKPVSMEQGLPPESLKKIDYWYAKDYQWTQDFGLIIRGYRWLGT